MKVKILSLLVVTLVSLTLVSAGCQLQYQEPEEVSLPPSVETSASSEEAKYSGLGLTEEEIQILKKRGIANVASVEVASRIAGFKVAVPSYIPEGFRAGKFMVQLSGGGMPEELKPKFNNIQVNQYYTWSGEKYPMFLLIQGPHKFGISGSEPTEICGRPGERTITKADPRDETAYDTLSLGWESGGIYYAIIAVLGENLDEATLEKIACSVGTN
jgi:hypothetical protein